MTPEEIKKRNEQILFMGGFKKYPKLEGSGLFTKKENTYYFDNGKKPNFLTKRWFIDAFNFQSNWNLLMQSVEFIENLKIPVNISSNHCVIQSKGTKDNEFNPITYVNCYGKDKLEAVYIAVSDFAKLYNNGEITT